MENEKPEKEEIVLTTHARERMEERKISSVRVIDAIEKGKKIFYEHGKEGREYKQVMAVCKLEENRVIVITVFEVSRTFEQKVKNIAPSGQWWHQGDLDVFIKQGYFLIDKGLDEDEVIDHLTALERAVSGEYGT